MNIENDYQRRRSAFTYLISVVVCSLLLLASTKYFSDSSVFMRNDGIEPNRINGRRLSALGSTLLYNDPKTVAKRIPSSKDYTLPNDNEATDHRALQVENEASEFEEQFLSNTNLPSVFKGDIKKEHQQSSVKKYSIDDALSFFDYYDSGVALFAYDPKEDKFNVFYPESMIWEESRFIRIRQYLFNSFRVLFPDRFTPDSPEFVVPVASMDYPQVKFEDMECFRNGEARSCVPDNFSPVLQFGSVFQLPKVPSMIPMPMPTWNHLGCFKTFAKSHNVCKQYKEKDVNENPDGFVFGETVGLGWDDLIPQVVWRATDRGYLSRMNTLRRPDFENDIDPKLAENMDDHDRKISVTNALREVYDELVPRWKGVVWSAEAELEAEVKGDNSLPWCNIKYAKIFLPRSGEDTGDYYDKFMDYGIPAIGESMDLETLAKYKYHMDIGGGGGTTWSGTLEKLAMPGVLFHHKTPTKDYNHDRIKPWVHYIPLQEDMKDLKEKYEWAESHPKEAREISGRATAFIKSLGTNEGFEGLFNEVYAEPLRQVVNAYEPFISDDGTSWQETIEKKSVEDMYGRHALRLMMTCDGNGEKNANNSDDCEDIYEGEEKRRESSLRLQVESKIEMKIALRQRRTPVHPALRGQQKDANNAMKQRRTSVHPKSPLRQ